MVPGGIAQSLCRFPLPRIARLRVRVIAIAAVAVTVAVASGVPSPADGVTPPARPTFIDVTADANLSSFPSLKYGGPVVADLDDDGTYDLVLSNHMYSRALVYWGVPGTTRYTGGESLLPIRGDVHGITAGDLGGGGGGGGRRRKHIMVSMGGSGRAGPPWGTSPRAPLLYEVRADRSWVDVTRRRGLSSARQRGRAVRLVDLTGNGRLDAVLFGSAVLVDWDKSPRQKVFLDGERTGGPGRMFQPQRPSGIGDDRGEGVFLVDLNGDGVMDAFTFSKHPAVYIGVGDGTFSDASASWLADLSDRLWVGTPRWAPLTSVAALDYNADGRPDLYVTVNGSRDVLLRNTGSQLLDASAGAGLAPAPGAPPTTLHVAVTVGDVNNDGHEDLIPFSHASASVAVFLNRGDGTFARTIARGMANNARFGRGDGGQAYDADGDGRVDVLLSQGDRGGPIHSIYRLFRNVTPWGTGAGKAGRWLAVAVGRSPRGGSATGAKVTVTTPGDRRRLVRWVGGAGDVFSQSLLDTVHVGVAAAAKVNVQVVWSDGGSARRWGVATNRRVALP